MAGDELIGHDDVLHHRELELGLHELPIGAEDGPSSRFGTTANPHARRLRPTQAGLRSSSWRRSKITLTKGSSARAARSFRWISSWSLATTTSHRGVNLSKIRGCAYTLPITHNLVERQNERVGEGEITCTHPPRKMTE